VFRNFIEEKRNRQRDKRNHQRMITFE